MKDMEIVEKVFLNIGAPPPADAYSKAAVLEAIRLTRVDCAQALAKIKETPPQGPEPKGAKGDVLSEGDLTEIEKRLKEVTEGMWTKGVWGLRQFKAFGAYKFVVNETKEAVLMECLHMGFPEIEALCRYPQDMTALLAEVKRVRVKADTEVRKPS